MHSTLNIILIALLCCGKKSSQTVVCYAQLHSSFLHAQQSSRTFAQILGIIGAARSGSASFAGYGIVPVWIRMRPHFFKMACVKNFLVKINTDYIV